MEDPAQAAGRSRSERLDRLPVAPLRPGRRPQGPGRAGRRGRHVQPHDLPGRDRRGRRLRRPDPRAERRARRAEGDLHRARRRRHPRRLRRPAPVYDEGNGKDGYVSLEVDPNLAHETEARSSEAKRLHGLVDRPNLFIKIPATQEGLQAIEETIAAGIPVNVTLIFSLERHRKVAEAYVRGLQRFVDGGGDLSARSPPSPRSSSRASTPRPTSASTRSAATTSSRASSRSPTPSSPTRPTRRSSRRRSGRRWWPRARPSSAACGRRPRPRTPSTATSVYVEELVGPDTVNTMPRERRGRSRTTARSAATRCSRTSRRRAAILDDLEAAGVDYDDVVDTLEKEGVEKFADSFKELFEDIESKRDQLVAA